MNRPKILAGTKQIHDIQGFIKSSPEDFVVDETPLYTPCGEGEHLYINVRKKNMSHDELLRRIAKEFGVSRRDIGVAGRKDLRAVTTQMVSIHLPGTAIIPPKSIGSIEVLSHARHTNKLRLGHLVGNTFSIKLRGIDLHQAATIETNLKALAAIGLPNAFGPQRFGNMNNNHLLGIAVVLEDWEGLIQELLRGDARHHSFASEREYKKALDSWPFGQPAERSVLELLHKGKSPKLACHSISKSLRKLWVNAFQSSLFNEVLSRRIQDGTWDTIIEGDIVWNHEHGGRTFKIAEDEVESEEILNRTTSFELSPTGPLWGAKMRLTSGIVQKLEQSVLHSSGVSDSHLRNMINFTSGARRPLRVRVGNPSVTTGSDSEGGFIKASFELPAGSYATIVINHLLIDEK